MADEITLPQFIQQERERVRRFEMSWRANQARDGMEQWPEAMPDADWAEQLEGFEA